MEKKECTKTKFANEEAAIYTLNKIAKKNQDRKRPTRSYKCKLCGLWHLTSRPEINVIIKENEALKIEIEDLKNRPVIVKVEKAPVNPQETKEFRKAVRKEAMYKELRKQMSFANEAIKKLYAEKDQLIYTIVKLRDEIEKLKFPGNNEFLAKSA